MSTDETKNESLWMNRSTPVLAGVVGTVVASYLGLVVVPNWQLDGLEPVQLQNGEIYPRALSDSAERGRDVYVDLGCVYCHSQQVRQGDFGSDFSRGWGRRASVPLDYEHAETPLFGTMRTGPDLRNIGGRQPSRDWHYLHLYNPQITSEGSNMPPFRFLFDVVPVDDFGTSGPPPEVLDLPEEYAIDDHYVVPTERGRDLVDYLLSLSYDAELPPGASSPPGAVGEGDTDGN
jgi:cytochrome c oxidase cbb3-type subunit 2